LLEDIRQATNKGLALGNDDFFADIESLTGKRVIEGERGRPVGWRKHKND
jgi:putative transposase